MRILGATVKDLQKVGAIVKSGKLHGTGQIGVRAGRVIKWPGTATSPSGNVPPPVEICGGGNRVVYTAGLTLSRVSSESIRNDRQEATRA